MASIGIGHNSRGGGRVYAITFDMDTESLRETYPNDSYTNAYTDIRNYLTARGFEWKQGSVYFGDDSIDAVKCIRVVTKLSKKFPWFKSSVRDIRMLRIEEYNDLLPVVHDDDED
jgi:virulence-associated protein VapD